MIHTPRLGTFIISIHECKNGNDLRMYEACLKHAGAEITDHKIDFKTDTVKFYIRLSLPDGKTIERFTERLQATPVWRLSSWFKP